MRKRKREGTNQTGGVPGDFKMDLRGAGRFEVWAGREFSRFLLEPAMAEELVVAHRITWRLRGRQDGLI